jgi:hypothetical protein
MVRNLGIATLSTASFSSKILALTGQLELNSSRGICWMVGQFYYGIAVLERLDSVFNMYALLSTVKVRHLLFLRHFRGS